MIQVTKISQSQFNEPDLATFGTITFATFRNYEIMKGDSLSLDWPRQNVLLYKQGVPESFVMFIIVSLRCRLFPNMHYKPTSECKERGVLLPNAINRSWWSYFELAERGQETFEENRGKSHQQMGVSNKRQNNNKRSNTRNNNNKRLQKSHQQTTTKQ